jgi:hypothetical protein
VTDLYTQGIMEDLDRRESGQTFDIEVDQFGVPRYVGTQEMFQGAEDQTNPFAIAGEVTPMGVGEFGSAVGSTFAGALGGAAGATAGLLGDLVGLGEGLWAAATAEEGQKIDAFLDTFSARSEAMGSGKTIGVYEQMINESDLSPETKEKMLAGSKYVGEWAEIPGGIKAATALLRGARRYASGAAGRVAERGTGMTLQSGIDPMAAVDEIIAEIQKATTKGKRKNLVSFIEGNPDGFTIDLAGGDIPPQGFVVAPLKQTEIFIDSKELTPEALDQLVDNVEALTKASGGKVYAGGWFDEETGRYVLDAVQVVDDREQALYLAAAGEQDAIFDLGELNVVRTTDGLQELRQSQTFDVGRYNEQRANQAKLVEGFRPTGVQNEVASTTEQAAGLEAPPMPENLTPALQIKEAGETAPPSKGNKVLVDDAGQYLVAKSIENHGRKLDPIKNPEDLKTIINEGVSEASYQLNQPISGEKWYDDDVTEAFKQTSKVIPELAVDEGLRVVMTAMAALTSPGTRAAQNWKNASAVMEEFLNTGKISGRNPANGKYFGGTRGPIIEKQLQLLEYLLKTKGVQGTADWLVSEHTVKDLTNLRQESGLYSAANKVSGKASDQKFGAFLFGEKVGPFMLNLNGMKETTADVWFSRTYNRLTGQLFDTPDNQIVGGPRNETERDIMKKWNRAIAGELGRDEQSIQAVLWYFEQQLYYSLGVKSARSEAFSDGAKSFTKDKGLSDSVRSSDANQAGGKPQGPQATGQGTVRAQEINTGSPDSGMGGDQ